MEVRPLPSWVAAMVLAQELCKNVLLLALSPVRRSKSLVSKEYDEGEWKEALQQRAWEKTSSLDEYLHPLTDKTITAKVENRLVHISVREYYQFRTNVLAHVVSEFAQEEQDLVEVGCGWGRNLFSLALKGDWNKLVGLDMSKNALEAGRSIRAHFGLMQTIELDEIDLTDKHHQGFDWLRGKTILTYYALEQLKYHTQAVIEFLVDTGVKRVLHIEPTIELLRLASLQDLVTYLYIKRKDYQDNLLTTLECLERKGRLRILQSRRLYYAPTLQNDPTLVCWEPV